MLQTYEGFFSGGLFRGRAYYREGFFRRGAEWGSESVYFAMLINIIVGSDEEMTLMKAVKRFFPSGSFILCTWRKALSWQKDNLIVVSDEETILMMAVLVWFPSGSLIMSTRHVQENVRLYLYFFNCINDMFKTQIVIFGFNRLVTLWRWVGFWWTILEYRSPHYTISIFLHIYHISLYL